MNWQKSCAVQIDQFEGALELLLRLVHEREIAVESLSVHELARQCRSWWQKEAASVEAGAEGVAMLSQLIWLKSRALLPLIKEDSEELETFDSPLALLPHVLEYCRFKEVAKELSSLEERGGSWHTRTAPAGSDWRPPLGIEHLTLQELASLFQQVIARAEVTHREIHEEECKLSDSIAWLRRQLKEQKRLSLLSLFQLFQTKVQLIVLFLATLELMKNEEIWVERDQQSGEIQLRSCKAV